MAKKTQNIGGKIIFFILGMVVMLLLDMFFHFNNSVQKELDNSVNKVQKKIENVLK